MVQLIQVILVVFVREKATGIDEVHSVWFQFKINMSDTKYGNTLSLATKKKNNSSLHLISFGSKVLCFTTGLEDYTIKVFIQLISLFSKSAKSTFQHSEKNAKNSRGCI